jgi:hypothetical protein
MCSAASRQNDDFHDRNPLFPIVALGFLAAALLVMVLFAPKIPLSLTADGMTFRKIHTETQERDYFVRIYGPVSGAGDISPENGPAYSGIRPGAFGNAA